MSSFELIARPKIDQAAARKMESDTKEAIARAGQQASARTKSDIENALENGMRVGGKSGFDYLKQESKGFSDSFGGMMKLSLAGIAAAASAVLVDTLQKTVDGADEFGEILKQRANAQRQVEQTGAAFGMTAGQYGELSIGAKAMGMEPEDLTGMISGFVGSLSRPEMAKYKELTDEIGTGSGFMDLLQNAASMDKTQSQQFLDSTLGGDDSVKAGQIVNVIREMNAKGIAVSMNSLASAMAGFQINESQLNKDIDSTKGARREFNQSEAREYMASLTQNVSSQDASDIESRRQSQEALLQKQLSNLHVKVEYANKLDTLTVNQLNAGSTVINSVAKESTKLWSMTKDIYQTPVGTERLKKIGSLGGEIWETDKKLASWWYGLIYGAIKDAASDAKDSIAAKHSQESNRR